MNDIGKAIESIKHYLEPTRIIVECPKNMLSERTIKKIGKYSIRKDPPHTGGDEYHAHCTLGGHEVCWTVSGSRKHLNKFPADSKIPNDVKSGIADILGISVNVLECWQIRHSQDKEEYVVTIREAKAPDIDSARIPENG
jgi:hypothetical protein